MKRYSLLIIVILVISLMIGCTKVNPNPPPVEGNENNNGTGDNNGNTGEKEPVVSKEIPQSFPDELVPLYDVAEVQGVIQVGDDYHQAYFFSNTEREELVEKYREFYKNQEVQLFENEFSYELSGDVDGHKIRIYIMPYTEEDENAVTTNSTITAPVETTQPRGGKYQTTVIIFIYRDKNAPFQ